MYKNIVCDNHILGSVCQCRNLSMGSAERIEKYWTDLTQPGLSADRMAAEMMRLCTWLLQLCETMHKHRAVAALTDTISTMYSTYLCLPEGKLTNGKLKAKVIRLLDEISALQNAPAAAAVTGQVTRRDAPQWSVVDLDMATKRLSLLLGDELRDNVVVADPVLWKALVAATDAEATVAVTCDASGTPVAMHVVSDED